MASANTLPLALSKALQTGFFRSDDPGASGTIPLQLKSHAICEVVTATAESRALPAAGGHPVGTILVVMFKTDGGNLTITGADQSVVLTDAGDVVAFMVVDNNGTKAWRNIFDSRAQSALFGTKTANIEISNNWRVWDAIETNLAAADGTDDLGLETGTFGTTAPRLNVTVATPSDDPFYARAMWIVPQEYKAGTNLTLDITVDETVAATTATVDAVVVNNSNSESTDICATAAQSVVGAAPTTYSFTLTGTNVEPGDVLDIRVALTLTDVAATPEYDITAVNLDYTAG